MTSRMNITQITGPDTYTKYLQNELIVDTLKFNESPARKNVEFKTFGDTQMSAINVQDGEEDLKKDEIGVSIKRNHSVME